MSQSTPGWYPDPERPGATRYWDGAAWAPSSPAPASAPTGPPGYGPPGYGAPAAAPKTDGFAIAALVLSILGGLLLAVIFAFVARGRIKRSNGTVTGKGLTTAALVISGLWLLAIAGFVALGLSGALDQENADDFQGTEREVALVVDRFEEASAQTICDDIVTESFRGGSTTEACVAAFDLPSGRRAQIDVRTITVTGDTAVAVVEEDDDTLTISFVRQDGEWRIDDITG